MASLASRLQLWAVTMALVAAQFGVMALFVEYGAFSHFSALVQPDLEPLIAIGVLLVGGVLLARQGYYRFESHLVQFVGILCTLVAYGLVGQYALEVYDVLNPFYSLQVITVAVVGYLSVLFWYASVSAREFTTLDAKAVIVLFAVGILAVGGYFMPVMFFAAFLVATIPLIMHMFHVIGLFEQVNLKPVRHGMRLYVSIFAFYVELTLYFFRALKRIFL